MKAVAERHIYFVDAAHSGTRLDSFLTGHLPELSRSQIKALIESGRVTVDGSPGKPATRVHRGQRIDVDIPAATAPVVAPEPMSLDVIYEDSEVVVVNKPAGLTVHPGAGRAGGTLVNAILARIPDLAGVGDALRPGIVHRLDKDTSGLLVIAKTPRALASLQEQVASRRVTRRYLALVHGTIPHEQGTIDAPIGRHPRHRTKMAVVPGGREAITRYRVIERFARHTLVEAQLVTGRTHQIRVHFAHIGHPVAGDQAYARRRDDLQIGRQALHAFRLQFNHPASGEAIMFEAPLPPDLERALARLRATESPPSDQ